jgi:hypothetical protein
MKRMAAILLAFLTITGSAQALTVSGPVGPLVKEAQTLAQAGDYKGARAKLDEADAVKSTPDDATVINQIRQYIDFRDRQTPPTAPPSQP